MKLSGRGTTVDAAPLGMRRISAVVVAAGPGGARCSVVGIGGRLPAVRPVPLSTAAALARAGVPAVVRSRGGRRVALGRRAGAAVAGMRG